MSLFSGVSIGSIGGQADINVLHSNVKCYMGGNDIVGIGTISGNSTNLNIDNSFVQLDLRGENALCAGCYNGTSRLSVRQASARFIGEGAKALAYGSHSENGDFLFDDSDVTVRMKSTYTAETLAPATSFRILNGRVNIKVNDDNVEREIESVGF